MIRMAVKLELKGLSELMTAMRKVDAEAKKEFSAELREIGKMVSTDAASDMPTRSGKAKRSVKVKVVTRRGFEGVQIAEGSAAAPYVPWLDFGGRTGRGRRTTLRVSFSGDGRVRRQNLGSRGTGSVVRPYIKEGRYLYPAYYRRYDDMVRATLEAVNRAARRAGLEVTQR